MRMNGFRYLIVGTLFWICLLVVGGCASLGSNPLEEGLTAYEAQDYKSAVSLWTPLAEEGDSEAQFNMGVMYDRGQGVEADPVTALKWYRLAADQGHCRAQYSLGYMYRHGMGTPRDFVKAVDWYRLAASQGEEKAQHNLGVMYYKGLGVPQDLIQAYQWFTLAESGSEKAKKARQLVKSQLSSEEISKV